MNMRTGLILSMLLVVSVVKAETHWNTWMEDNLNFIGNYTLNEIMIPGTHDSGAFTLSDKMCPNGDLDIKKWVDLASKLHIDVTQLIRKWGIAQPKNIYTQLTSGVRHLDLRAMWDDGEWYTHHALEGNTIDSILKEIIQFLDETKDEIIILEVGHTSVSSSGYNNTELIIKLEDALGQWLVPNTLSVLRMSINELLANHYRVLLTFDDRSDASYSKYAFYIHDLIQGEYANSDDIATMTNHNQQLIEQRDPNYLLELSWTLTAQSKTILDSLLVWNPQSLLELAKKGNKHFDSFYEKNKQLFSGVIVTCDNYETNTYMQRVLEFNQSLKPKFL